MSINSILTNPKILDEIIAEVDSRISNVTIKTLENNDGNVELSVVDLVGTVNLKPNMSVNKITCSSFVQTSEITTSNSILSIEANNNKISLSQDNITLQINNDNYIELLNTNICNLVNTNLKLNNMISPYYTDGTIGQVLATDGNNTAIWADAGQPVGLVKNIFQFNQQMTPTGGASISVYINNAISGLTIGKTCLYDISFTCFSGVIGTEFTIVVTFDAITQSIVCNNSVSGVHFPKKIILSQINTTESVALGINLVSKTGTINVDVNDYLSLNVSEY